MSLVRPVDAVACLIPDRSRAEAAAASLHDAGHPAFPVRPERPAPTSLSAWGPDTTIMHLYDQGLHRGHILLVVPTSPDRREDVSRHLFRHGAHAVYYFTATSVECLSVLV
ncbi:hypothetical protein [Symbioplanes lichenis]|uniref:hypothetical protein n=1 Tax=Symbioplanes lichenis TaxID=1629072 RepID=UPI00273887C9|nr:hypothetical protein [Actinoplanes lichenis]